VISNRMWPRNPRDWWRSGHKSLRAMLHLLRQPPTPSGGPEVGPLTLVVGDVTRRQAELANSAIQRVHSLPAPGNPFTWQRRSCKPPASEVAGGYSSPAGAMGSGRSGRSGVACRKWGVGCPRGTNRASITRSPLVANVPSVETILRLLSGAASILHGTCMNLHFMGNP
jgi:hypothetical protein